MSKSVIPAKPLPKILSSKEVAAALGVSVASVQRLALSGQIASVKIGGQRKFAEHDIWVYLQRLRKESEQAAAKRVAALNATVPAPPPDDRQQQLDVDTSK